MEINDIKIVTKTQAIASVFDEYLEYYKPIYIEVNKQDHAKYNRKTQRDLNNKSIKAFNELHLTVRKMAKLFNKAFAEQYDQSIDVIHDELDKIKYSE